jgi:hypothetical protein
VRGAARIQMLKTKQDAAWRGVLSARIRLPPNRDRLIRISIFVDAPQSAGMANKPRERTWAFCALVSRAREREREKRRDCLGSVANNGPRECDNYRTAAALFAMLTHSVGRDVN